MEFHHVHHSSVRRVTMRDTRCAPMMVSPTMVTAYDALTAGVIEQAGVPALLVGDSAAMVVHGHDSTIPITVDDTLWCPFAAPSRLSSSPTTVRFLPRGPGASPCHLGSFHEGGWRARGEVGGRPQCSAPDRSTRRDGGSGHRHLDDPPVGELLGGYRVQGRGERTTTAPGREGIGVGRGGGDCSRSSPWDLAPVTEVLSIPPLGPGPCRARGWTSSVSPQILRRVSLPLRELREVMLSRVGMGARRRDAQLPV